MIRDHNLVTIVTIGAEDADLETRLAALLPEATQARLQAFTHRARRRQTLWGRLAALEIARERGLDLIETPPYPPILRDGSGHECALCIAHTGNKIAVGVADGDDPIMGLDIETLRPVRSVRAMSEIAFGPTVEWATTAAERSGSLEEFFLLWGMKESEIKLNRGGDRYDLVRRVNALGEEIRPDVLDLQTGRALAVHSRTLDTERLTVLTQSQEPLYFTVTADTLARHLLSGE